jgi:hypothetical protein
MLGLRRSGSRPAPSGGAGSSSWNGFAQNTDSDRKKPAKPSRIAVAYGVASLSRGAATRTARLAHSDISITHSSSEPSCEDQIAVAR